MKKMRLFLVLGTHVKFHVRAFLTLEEGRIGTRFLCSIWDMERIIGELE